MVKGKKASFPPCASCEHAAGRNVCYSREGVGSWGRPTLAHREALVDNNREYDRSEMREFARQASIQEVECYAHCHERPYVMQPTKTRIVEICEFAEKMWYKCMGLAFWVGLTKEAQVTERVLESYGLEVVSAVCKACRTPRSRKRLSSSSCHGDIPASTSTSALGFNLATMKRWRTSPAKSSELHTLRRE